RVTEVEFQQCFAVHADKLTIRREGPIYVLTPKDGAACPNWVNGSCAVYDERPRECRLFPFTLFVRKQADGLVSIGYHSDTRCPMKIDLLPPDEVARDMITSFGAEAFPGVEVKVTRESLGEMLRRRTLESVWTCLALVKRWLSGTPR